MKRFAFETTYPLHLRAFDVRIRDERTGETGEEMIVFTKQQLQAAHLVGQSSKELIHRAFNREGFTVLDIGKAMKTSVELDLAGLFCEATREDPEVNA